MDKRTIKEKIIALETSALKPGTTAILPPT